VPSKTAKQHRLMSAVAHNPAFAKKVGIPQSIGKEYAMADKGKKFRIGGLPASINKQDTKHGKMDMPFKSLKRFTGMKAGGKVRRYEDGGDVDLEGVGKTAPEGNFKDAFSSARSAGDKTFTWRGKSYTTELASPKKDYGDESARMLARAPAPKASASQTPANTSNAGAVTGRTMYDKSRPSSEQKEENTQRFRDATMTAASMAPAGRMVSAAAKGVKALGAARAARTAGAMDKAAAGTARQVAARDAAKEAAYDARRAADMEAGFKKGGMAKYAKGGNVKKATMGRSKKDIAADQMAMAPYDKGGMAKYARGGGIESKGKTQGKIVKMARGGGIESRGKTRGKMC